MTISPLMLRNGAQLGGNFAGMSVAGHVAPTTENDMSAPNDSRDQRPALSGLCASCTFAGSCMHLRRIEPPIWSCGDYADATPRRSGLATVTWETSAPLTVKAPGLCGNCDHVATCRLPKREGGVWQCEEYQ